MPSARQLGTVDRMERELQQRLDCFLGSPYGRTMLGEYAYLKARDFAIQCCEQAERLDQLPDWFSEMLDLGSESLEIFNSLTDAGTLETDRKTMSLLLSRRGSLLATTSARFRRELELHKPGPDLTRDAIEDATLAAQGEEPGLAKIVNRDHWEPKASFLPQHEIRVIGDVGGVPLVLVGYERNNPQSPIVARSTSGDPQTDTLFAVPLSDLMVHSREPVTISESDLELARP